MEAELREFASQVAAIDEERVIYYLHNIGTLLTDAERSQLESYARGVSSFNLLMTETALDAVARTSATGQEEMNMRAAVARYYQLHILNEDIKRAPELETH
jgi:hypothetical protein